MRFFFSVFYQFSYLAVYTRRSCSSLRESSVDWVFPIMGFQYAYPSYVILAVDLTFPHHKTVSSSMSLPAVDVRDVFPSSHSLYARLASIVAADFGLADVCCTLITRLLVPRQTIASQLSYSRGSTLLEVHSPLFPVSNHCQQHVQGWLRWLALYNISISLW